MKGGAWIFSIIIIISIFMLIFPVLVVSQAQCPASIDIYLNSTKYIADETGEIYVWVYNSSGSAMPYTDFNATIFKDGMIMSKAQLTTGPEGYYYSSGSFAGTDVGNYNTTVSIKNPHCAVIADSFQFVVNPSENPDDYLVAHYSFENNTNDKSKYKNHGIRHGPVYVPGIAGQALEFDGVDDYVIVPDDDSLDLTTQFTLSAWINKKGEMKTIISKDGLRIHDPNYAYNLYAGGDGVQYETNNIGYLNAIGTITWNEWHHVAVTHDASKNPNTIIYVDGEKKKSGNVPSPKTLYHGKQDLLIGRRMKTTLSFFNGTIDEVRIYNKALSAQEINQIINDDLSAHECSDSDGGDNIYERGIITGPVLTSGEKPMDYCLNYSENTLIEYSCSPDTGFSETAVTGLYSKSVNCEYGCMDGYCIEGIVTCYDTDVLDYYNKGTCIEGNITYEDRCFNETVLYEYDCITDHLCGIYPRYGYECPNGCKNGACINETMPYCGDGVCNKQTYTFVKGDSYIVSYNGKSYRVTVTFIGSNKLLLSVNNSPSHVLSQGPYELVTDLPVYVEKITPAITVGDKGKAVLVFGENNYICPQDCNQPSYCGDGTCGQNKTLDMIAGDKERITIGGRDYFIEIFSIDPSHVNISVNGNNMYILVGMEYTIDGLPVYVEDIYQSEKGRAVVQLGSEEITLTDYSPVIKGTSTTINGTLVDIIGDSRGASKLTVSVAAEDPSRAYIWQYEAFTDPVFGTMKLAFGGMASLNEGTIALVAIGSNPLFNIHLPYNYSIEGGVDLSMPEVNKFLNISDPINKIKPILTKSDLPDLLADGIITINGVANNYSQYIRLGLYPTIEYDKIPAAGIFRRIFHIRTGHGIVGVLNGKETYNYTVVFNRPLNFSDENLIGKYIELLGNRYTIGPNSGWLNPYNPLELFGPGPTVTLTMRKPINVEINGLTYTIEAMFIGSNQLLLRVDNAVSPELQKYSSEVVGGLNVYVKDIIPATISGRKARISFGETPKTCPEDCYEITRTCTDSDANYQYRDGNNPYEKGFCSECINHNDRNSSECGIIHEDYCLNSFTLMEYYCDGYECMNKTHYCKEGYECRMGECVPEKPKLRIRIEEGWNIISIPGQMSITGGNCTPGPYGSYWYGWAFYWWYPPWGRYVSYDEITSLNVNGSEITSELMRMAFWARSPMDCYFELEMYAGNYYRIADLPQIYTGYNMIMITEDMINWSLSDFKGTCEFDMIFIWDARNQAWERFPETEIIGQEMFGHGLLARAENNCRLGEAGPPPFPTAWIIGE